MQEILVQFLGQEALLRGTATRSSVLAWRIPMDTGVWRATVHGVAKSWTWLSDKAYSTCHILQRTHLHYSLSLQCFVKPSVHNITADDSCFCLILSTINLRASLVAQTVKNPPAMQEAWVQSLGWEEPLEEGMATHTSILAWRILTDREAWWATAHGVAKSRTQLSD